jgi:hypothetical protein
MIDLRPDGTIGITFASENGAAPKVVTVRPPTVGGIRRLRKELAAIDPAQASFDESLGEDLSEGEKQAARQEFHEERLLDWWQLVLVGDATFKALTSDEVPADRSGWPMDLMSNLAALQANAHWMAVPLPSTALPAPTANESQQDGDL